MTLRQTTKYTYKSGAPRKFYGCPRYPLCTEIHGAHENGEPYGVPADKETRQLRIVAHEAFDKFWKEGIIRRQFAYECLQECLGLTSSEAHIGKFTKEQCLKLIDAIETGRFKATINTLRRNAKKQLIRDTH